MKKILTFAALVVGLGLSSQAQDAPKKMKEGRKFMGSKEMVQKRSPEEIAKMRTERLDKELKFTDKQRQEVYAIQLEQAKKRKLNADHQKQMRQQQHNEMKTYHEDLSKLLTPEQQKLMKEKFANRQAFRKRGDGTEGRKFRDGKRSLRHNMEKKTEAVKS